MELWSKIINAKKNLNKEGLSGKKKVFLSLILIDIVNKLLYIWCDNDEGGGVYVCVYLYSEEGGKERNYCYFLSDTFSVPKVCVLYVFMWVQIITSILLLLLWRHREKKCNGQCNNKKVSGILDEKAKKKKEKNPVRQNEKFLTQSKKKIRLARWSCVVKHTHNT